MLLPFLIVIGIVIFIAVIYFLANIFMYKQVGPNEVLIISGGKRRKVIDPDGTVKEVGYRCLVGGGSYINPLKETARVLPLEVHNVHIKTPEVLTSKGVHIIAESNAQIKIASNEYSIRQAAEQFLSTGSKGIIEVCEQILEGYTRGVVGATTVEELFLRRDEFNNKVIEAASGDFRKLGLEVISYTLKDISDTQGYLASLGKPRIAEAKKDAAIAQAEADKETIINAAAARRDGDIAKFNAEAEIAAANRDYELKRSGFQAQVNKEKAKTDFAYELERQKLNQEIKKAEYSVKLIEKQESIKVEEAEIIRKEKELESSIKKNADAHAYQVQKEAEAERIKTQLEAEGKAEAAKLQGMADIEVTKQRGISKIAYERNLGLAEAEVKKADGEAEAENLRKKAESYASYNDAAIYQMLMDVMPELAKAVAQPLSNVEKIVMVGNGADGASKLTGQVASIIAQLPTVVESLSGVDIKKILKKMNIASDEEAAEK